MPRLSDKTILKGDENRSEESGGCPAFETAHCEIRERNGSNAHYSGKHSHCNIRHVLVNPAIIRLHLSTGNCWERSRTHLEISLKSKFPSYPKMNPTRVIRSFANGGCTSTKNWVLIYFEANLPK